MRWHARPFVLGFVPLFFLLTGFIPHASAQYLFLDTNGNGVRDEGDRIDPTGTTTIDIWLQTDRNRDGSVAICASDPGVGLTINSYTVAFDVLGGTVHFGPMQNRLQFSNLPVCFGTYEDTTNATSYHNGWGWNDILPPGKYRLATLTLEVTSGWPSLFVASRRRLQPSDRTSFGTKCDGLDFNNTHELGVEWTDAQGLGSPYADAGDGYEAQVGRPIQFNGASSLEPSGDPLTFSWDFGDGSTGFGATPTHAYAAAGHYTVTLTVSNGTEASIDQTEAIATDPQQPVARAGGPYSGYAGQGVRFSAAASYDPDGDLLLFAWNFGDGGTGSFVSPTHVYAAPGTYVIRLTVSDGTFSDTDQAIASIQDSRTYSPPAAHAGGPYESIVGRPVRFDGTRSADPDGDPLTFTWNFGDGPTSFGSGPTPGHIYQQVGLYMVSLTVSDGQLRNSAITSVTIRSGLPARAFGEQPVPTVVVGPSEAPLVLRVEPVNGSFRLSEADLWGVAMRRSGEHAVAEVYADGPFQTDGDSDGNGVEEFTVTFSGENLARLFGPLPHPIHETVTIAGGLYAGGEFLAQIALNVRQGAASRTVAVAPNPFNPQTLLTFNLTKSGSVTAHLFDVRGRMVRTVYRDQPLPAGTHEMILEARSDHGEQLASGIYFLRLVGPDGSVTKRVAVSK